MALFDAYVMVDWSAASKPTTGSDSIWIGHHAGGHTETENIPTRSGAHTRLHQICAEAVRSGKRLLIGFDFPFGYPAGVAKHVTGHSGALSLWRWIATRLKDQRDNTNNRFEVASEINRLYPGTGPFWGRPASWDFPDIPTKGSERTCAGHPPERRLVEQQQKSAQPVWKLYTTGSVGSQVLTGLPVVLALRDDAELMAHTAIWPFETGLATPTAQVTFAEIYPSLIPPDASEDIKDAGQVRAVADWLAGLDRDDALEPLFAGPPDASPEDRRKIASEEAWILGLGAPSVRSVFPMHLPGAPPANALQSPAPLRYERNPAKIYQQSFATVRSEANLGHLPEDLRDVAIRLVHACGMPDITNRLAWSDNLVDSARKALVNGAPILCDCEAVASMIIGTRLPANNPVVCTLNNANTRKLAEELGTTRSAAAVDLWQGQIGGAVIAIGNAPTALFHLLERLDQGWPCPAAIIGMPVGFVGAAESKAELAAKPRGTPFLTLRGRRGGSAMAAAAINALAAGLETP